MRERVAIPVAQNKASCLFFGRPWRRKTVAVEDTDYSTVVDEPRKKIG
jgi:hypothetical protein